MIVPLPPDCKVPWAGSKKRDGVAVSRWDDRPRRSNPLIEAAIHQPLLAPAEEKELARRAEAGDEEALRRLVTSHLRFVIAIARRYRGWGLPMNELIQQGALGLVQAVRRFDPERGVRLSTYAMWSIRSAIQEHVLHSWSMVRLGTSTAQKMLALRLRRIAEEVAQGDGETTDPRIARLAERFNATASEVARLARRMTGRDRSLDQQACAGPAAIDRLACPQATPEQALAEADDHRLLASTLGAAIAALTPREQVVIRKRYFEDVKQTFEAIGRELGVSKDRARQLEVRALAKLQAMISPVAAGLFQ
ncbi:MAG: sigma-70 family RNA polymerase sigma factor [Rhodospirillales bacterium]|nr:sigma-70 family RNA polymerase sigma factor [Rhodospirillales bacterium]